MQGDLEDREDKEHESEKSFTEFIKGMFPRTDVAGMPTTEWLQSKFRTKSAIIRFLNEKAYTIKQIASHLGIRGQHVRNVIGQELKRGPNEAYQEVEFGCSHEKSATTFVDVVLKKSVRDLNQSRILYRVCTKCAVGIIPGVTEESISKHLPGKE